MRPATFVLIALLLSGTMLSGAAWAQANLEINTPAISTLQAGMRQRHAQLAPFYGNGAVGLTRDGLVAMHDANAAPLAQRQQVNALIAGENQDRLALYREVARANNHPEWEGEIRTTFARRWIERAPAGWYYQDTGGSWVRK